MWLDASKHRSVNAGWPESAAAGALGIALAGPRRYGQKMVDDGWMGAGRREVEASDIERALNLYVVACAILIVAVLVLAVVAR